MDARKQKRKSLEKQVSELQLEIKRLKKAMQAKKPQNKKNASPSLLTSLDPEKINGWITLLTNPAVKDLLKQFSSTPEQPAPAVVSRRRRRRLFLF